MTSRISARGVRWLLAAVLALGLVAVPAYVVQADTQITSSNQSEDSEVKTGDVESNNSSSGFVGHQGGGGSTGVGAEDISASSGTNIQEGDNDFEADQTANSRSGSAVGGQVIGAVSEGDLIIDATNLTASSDAQSGDADAENSSAAFVGLAAGSSTAVGAADISLASGAANVQEGDNSGDVDQTQNATSGDALTGQIVAGITSAGGSADIVTANTTEDSSSTSGDADEQGSSALFVGLDVSTGTTTVG
jgi:hypothetical protein